MIKEAEKINANNRLMRQRMQRTVFRCMIGFVTALLISGALYHGDCFVGAVAFVGAAGAGLQGAFVLLGALSGYWLTFGFDSALHYMAAGLFVYTIAYIFQFMPFYRSNYFMPMVVMAVIAIIRAFGAVDVVRSDSNIISEITIEILLSGALTYLYAIIFKNQDRSPIIPSNQYSISAILATLIMSLSSIQVMEGISVAGIIAMTVYMVLIYESHNHTSYPIGLMFGLALQHSGGREEILPIFVLYSLSDVFPIKNSKLWLSAYFLFVSPIIYLISDSSELIMYQLGENIVSILLFLILSHKVRRSDRDFSLQLNSLKESKTLQLISIAEVMQSIADRAEHDTQDDLPQEPDLTEIFDRAASTVCGQCVNRSICWNNQIFDMVNVLEESSSNILKRGKMVEQDLPDYFIGHCTMSDTLILAVNYELLRYYDEQNRNYDICINNHVINRQFKNFSSILRCIAAERESSNINEHQLPNYLQGEIGIASVKKTGERVCGDSVRYFKTDCGMMYVILSDGIGTGVEAQKCSSTIVSILEECLKVLNDPILSMELASIALSAQELSAWKNATIDIAAINMKTGDVSFYKMGAADSYIINRDEMISIHGNALSAGSAAYIPDTGFRHTHRIKKDSIIVMASDGICFQNPCIIQEKLKSPYGDMKSAAREILLSSSSDDSDDRTLILLSLATQSEDTPNRV